MGGDEKDQEKEKVAVVMDTPERSQIVNPLSKFEDSPVFNYINNLSPIKPVKSLHFTQTFSSLSSLSFASLPSVFTSPHVSSLKDSQILRRHQISVPSKPELPSVDAKKGETNEGNLNAVQRSLNDHHNPDLGHSVTTISIVPSSSVPESRKLSNEASFASGSLVPFVNNDSAKDQMRIETEASELNPLHNEEVTACDWESLMSDASGLLNFDSPSDSAPYKDLNQSTLDDTKQDSINDNPLVRPEGVNQKPDTTSLSNFEVAEDTDNEIGSNLYRGMRRRCLVFEMTGNRMKRLEDVPSGSSVSLSTSNETVIRKDSSRCILPGIGLHLNALASTLVDHKVVTNESSGSGRQLILVPPSVNTSMASAQESADTTNLFENNSQNEVPVAEDASKALGFGINEELSLSQTSPRKKRRRTDLGGESEACKRCNCKKSKCLKLYCECFAAGVYCVEPCSCQECFNKPIHEDTVLATRKQIESRNPLAFAPKVIKTSDSMQEDEPINTPASARHKRGCNCKKSGCQKKYCECFQGGVGCSVNCRCEGCQNSFGRKDGLEMDIEANTQESEENTDISLQKMPSNIEAELISAATPSFFGRQSTQLPSSSKKGKPPRSFLTTGSSSTQRFGKLNPFKGRELQPVGEDEIPEILEENSSLITGVKSCSPNSKRVSPPHSSMGIATDSRPRNSRKLILQSIPAFPCLTSNTEK